MQFRKGLFVKSSSLRHTSCSQLVNNHIGKAHLGRTETTVIEELRKGRFQVENDDRLPAPSTLELKVGAQVMFTKNDEEKKWVNGTLGKVVRLTPTTISVEVNDDHFSENYVFHRAVWEKYVYEYNIDKEKIERKTIGSYTQFPLILAWAITIHKSQGKTLPKVFIDTGRGAFAEGQVYVALSRVRSMNDVQLARPLRGNEIRCSEEINRFDNYLSKVTQPSST